MRPLTAVAAPLALVLAFASPASAVRIYGSTNHALIEYNMSGGPIPRYLQLGTNISGTRVGDTLAFNVAKRGNGTITVTVECGAKNTMAGSAEGRIRPVINGVPVGGFHTFCNTASNGVPFQLRSTHVWPLVFQPRFTQLKLEVHLGPAAFVEWVRVLDLHLVIMLQKA